MVMENKKRFIISPFNQVKLLQMWFRTSYYTVSLEISGAARKGEGVGRSFTAQHPPIFFKSREFQLPRYFSEIVTLSIASPVKVGFWVGSRRVRPLTTSMPLITCPKMV